MLKRLRIKFICINMLIVTAMLCVILGMVFYFTKQNLEAESLRMMETIAEKPSRMGPPGQRHGEVRLPYFVLEIGLSGSFRNIICAISASLRRRRSALYSRICPMSRAHYRICSKLAPPSGASACWRFF